jgi:hypothetical protein
MEMPEREITATKRSVWNAGRTVGAKRALKPKQIWEIRFYLNQRRRLRDRALFDLAIDSKLRGCDLVQMKIGDLVSGGQIRTRAIVMQQKTGRPVQFELLPDARASLLAWLERRGGTVDDYVFPSRVDHNGHLSTRQYARLVDEWVTGVGLMRSEYGSPTAREQFLTALDVRPIEGEPATATFDETPQAIGPDPSRHAIPEAVSCRCAGSAGDDDARQRQAASCSLHAGEWHDDLRRNWWENGLGKHHKGDAGVTELGCKLLHPLYHG